MPCLAMTAGLTVWLASWQMALCIASMRGIHACRSRVNNCSDSLGPRRDFIPDMCRKRIIPRSDSPEHEGPRPVLRHDGPGHEVGQIPGNTLRRDQWVRHRKLLRAVIHDHGCKGVEAVTMPRFSRIGDGGKGARPNSPASRKGAS